MKRLTRRPMRPQVALEPQPEQSAIWFPPPAPKVETTALGVDDMTPCRVCGGAVQPGGRMVGPWREHPECAGAGVNPHARLSAAVRGTGIGDVTPDEAALLPYRVHKFCDVHPEPTYQTNALRDRLRWRHVDRKALVKTLRSLDRLKMEAGLLVSTCEDGPCAWCGILRSKGWTSHGHRWPHAEPAPLCGACSAVYLRRGEPSPDHWDEQRGAICEAMTDVPVGLGETPPQVQSYAEALAAGGSGTGEPWSHLPAEAVESYRWASWARYAGRYAPAEHRVEAMRRAAETEAQKAARHAAQSVEQRAREDVWGFGHG